MSFTFNIGYRTPISSKALNEKLHEVWGRNGVLTGLTLSKHSNTQVKISSGIGIVRGVKVQYTEDNAGNPLRVTIPLTTDGKKYVYGLYNHTLSAFTLHVTDGKYDAQGDWKIFLGHAEVKGGAILNVQPIVDSSNTEVDNIYKKLPNMNEMINLFYETTIQIGQQITDINAKVIGNMNNLKTNHKTTVVGSINELFDTKEPTLTRDRILGLLGGGENGGNIDIGSINNIPIGNFVLKDRAIRTPNGSGLKGGGDLSTDRSLSLDFGTGENQPARGNHNHWGHHLDKKFEKQFGESHGAAVYSQLAYFASDDIVRGKVIKITLPKDFVNVNLGIDIKGFDGGGSATAYTLKLVGAMNKSAGIWDKCTADILGTAPFSYVKFGKDWNGRPCIMLDGATDGWNKTGIFLEQVLVSGEDTHSWGSGWHIEFVDSLSGITIQQIPKLTTGGPQKGDYVTPYRAVNAGTGLQGGGSLQKDVWLSVDFGTGANQVAKGNHTHSNYLGKKLTALNRVVVTDGDGNITTNTITTTKLGYLSNVTKDIQSQINDKAASNHGHTNYVPFSGGEMNGSLSFPNSNSKKLSVYHFYIRGYRLTIAGGEPSVKDKGTVWIDLPF